MELDWEASCFLLFLYVSLEYISPEGLLHNLPLLPSSILLVLPQLSFGTNQPESEQTTQVKEINTQQRPRFTPTGSHDAKISQFARITYGALAIIFLFSKPILDF